MADGAVQQAMAITPFIVDKLREEPPDVVGVVGEPRRPPAGVLFFAKGMRCAVLHFVEIFRSRFFYKLELMTKYRSK